MSLILGAPYYIYGYNGTQNWAYLAVSFRKDPSHVERPPPHEDLAMPVGARAHRGATR